MIFVGMPQVFSIFHIDSLCTLSKAFLKSTKLITTGVCHISVFSMICLSVKRCSQHDLPGLNPVCSWRSFSSMASRMRLSITVAMIFPGVDSEVMPLQFEHSLMSPFFGRGIMIPFLHSFGTLPKRHTLLHSFVSCTRISSPPMLYHLWTYFVTSGRLPDLQVLD